MLKKNKIFHSVIAIHQAISFSFEPLLSHISFSWMSHSQLPPYREPAGGLKCDWTLGSTIWIHLSNLSSSSKKAFDCIESVLRMQTSRCTASTARHTKITLYLFTDLLSLEMDRSIRCQPLWKEDHFAECCILVDLPWIACQQCHVVFDICLLMAPLTPGIHNL